MFETFFSTHFVPWVLVPFLIFASRILDVSIGTMRVIFVARGYKFYAAFAGFFEVLVWIIAITQIFKNLTNPFYYIAYAAGFASGNYIGMLIEEKIALGTVLLRIVTPNDIDTLTNFLRENKFGVTSHDAQGLHGNVKIIFTILPRTKLIPVIEFIKRVNPGAFYTVEDIRFINESNLSYRSSSTVNRKPLFFRRSFRKGK